MGDMECVFIKGSYTEDPLLSNGSVPATTSSTRCCQASGTVSPITYSSAAPYVARSIFRISLKALHRMSVNY